jgi:hypothetical protein
MRRATRSRRVSCVVAGVLLTAPCRPVAGGAAQPASASLDELWIDPAEALRHDGLHGPGGLDSVPPRDGTFEVMELDVTGFSRGYSVVDTRGRRWDVKIGPEAQSEVVASRVLWLSGYHQPVVHFLTRWRRRGDETRWQPSGRFRLESDHGVAGEWAWGANPFVGSRELKGLVAINLLLNNWDFKTSNNRVYTTADGARATGLPRWFVVQDLGASLGRSGWPFGDRNDVDSFESQRYVARNGEGGVTFDYRGRHREVFEDVAAEDVVWACRLLSRITDAQWADVFRAAAYPDAVASRYRRHLALKIAEGLALDPQSRSSP